MVVQQDVFYSHSFLVFTARLESDHKLDCLFLQGLLCNTLEFRKCLRNPPRFWGLPFWKSVSNVSREGSGVVGKFSRHYRVIWLVCPVWSTQGSSLLFPDCCILTAYLMAVWQASCFFVSCSTGSSKFLGKRLHTCGRCRGKCSPCILCFLLSDREGLYGIFSPYILRTIFRCLSSFCKE